MAFSYLHLTEKLENFWMKSEDCVNILSQDQLDTQRYVKNFNPFTLTKVTHLPYKKCQGRLYWFFGVYGTGWINRPIVICFCCYFLICAQQRAATYVHTQPSTALRTYTYDCCSFSAKPTCHDSIGAINCAARLKYLLVLFSVQKNEPIVLVVHFRQLICRL